MPGSHARLAPSAAHRWSECPGSIALSEGRPETSSKYADEGTILHAQIAGLLPYVRETRKTEFPHLLGRHVGEPGVKDLIEIDETRLNALQSCAQCFLDHSGGAPNTLAMIEQRVRIPGRDDVYGTSDVIILDRPLRRLSVIDWKFGSGVRVFAKENWQAVIYALGALVALELLEDIDRVRIVIHQPMIDHHDEWEISADDLRGWLPRILDAARRTDTERTTYHDGDWCIFCPAKADCPRLAATALAVAKSEFGDLDLTRASPDQLAQAMAAIPRIQEWISAIRGEVLARLTREESVPGWKLVEGRRARSYADELDAYAFATKLGDEGFTAREVISPAQMEKVAKRKGVPIPDGLFAWTKGAPVAAPMKDERGATTTAALEFDALPDNDL